MPEDQLNLDQITQEPKESELIITVTELNRRVKSCLENNFAFIWVKGEISNFKVPLSGHFYFSLKDEKSQVRAVMFRGYNTRLIFTPEDGMEVLVKARVSLYEGTGSYQLICESMEPIGHGALKIQFEQLKAKLEKEGLFDKKHKKPIPSVPHNIAVVTSPTGAAIKDILNVLDKRFKGLDITIFPTMVQGEAAAKDIIRSIELANSINYKFDVIIIARGGGSMEDLWCFNDEQVVRAIYKSQIPIVSGVGHEIDFTISDFVADVRAPTPSAAAMLVVKNKLDIIKELQTYKFTLLSYIKSKIKLDKENLSKTASMIVNPKRKCEELSQRCDSLFERLCDLAPVKINNLKNTLDILGQKIIREVQILMDSKKRLMNRLVDVLNSLSPLETLTRGYSITRDKKSAVIKSINQVGAGESINVIVADGEITSEVTSLKEKTWSLKKK